MSLPESSLRSLLLLLAATLAFSAFGFAQASPHDEVAYEFHAVVPLGIETFTLEPQSETMNLLASAESPLFEGVKLLGHGRNRRVLAPDGSPIRHFPEQIAFRVTASARGKALDDKPFEVGTTDDLNDYLLGLRFRLKVFQGLEYREISPLLTEQVGVPADVPYSERVYRVVFPLDNVTVEERILLEVYDSSGSRLTRFHLEMM
jgi:hypothetical protein